MMAYFPLGTAAVYKALWEAARRPFFWDKTSHGVSRRAAPDAVRPGWRRRLGGWLIRSERLDRA
ncbi:MAG: hypothetical protein ACU0CO_04575 [Shimia sp.]